MLWRKSLYTVLTVRPTKKENHTKLNVVHAVFIMQSGGTEMEQVQYVVC